VEGSGIDEVRDLDGHLLQQRKRALHSEVTHLVVPEADPVVSRLG
jgi:hypothetical protein